MSSDFDDFYSENKPKIDALKLDENSLVFPTKKGTQLRDTHLTALQYANGCIRVAEATNNAVIESTNQINEKNDRDDFVFSSDIVFITKNYSEIILKNVLENIFDADVAAQYLSEIKRNAKIKKLYYGHARLLRNELKKNNIETVIVNNAMDKVLHDTYESDKISITNEFNKDFSFVIDALDRENEKKANTRLGLLAGVLHYGAWICFILIMLTGVMIAVLGFRGALPLIICVSVIILFIVGFIIIEKKSGKKIKTTKQKFCGKTQLKKIIDTYEQCFDFIKIHSAIDKEVVSGLYDKTVAVNEQFIIFGKSVAEFWLKVDNAVKEINYLPKGLDNELLPRMIDLLESGSAVDYRSALRQAEQDYRDEKAKDKQNELLKQAEEKIQKAILAEKEMKEYYERQRLYEQREAIAKQSESQRRTEEYARKQAESAQLITQYTKEAAEAAKKQSETTEEMLRRSQDPSYIKRWKDVE